MNIKKIGKKYQKLHIDYFHKGMIHIIYVLKSKESGLYKIWLIIIHRIIFLVNCKVCLTNLNVDGSDEFVFILVNTEKTQIVAM